MSSQPAPEKIKILLVDDRPENLLALRAILTAAEYELIEATSGAQAIALAEAHSFAIALLDVQMPILDGFETTRKMRRIESFSHTPVIFVTAVHDNLEYAHQAYDLGAIDYLGKPLDPHVVRSKVAFLCELFRKNKEIARLRHEAEQRLKSSEQFAERIIESSQDCIKILDLEGRLLSIVNDAVNAHGQKTADMSSISSYLGRDYRDFWQGVDRKNAEIAIKQAQNGKIGKFLGFCPSKKKEPLWWDVVISPIFGLAGKTEKLLVVSRDVTDRKRAALRQEFAAQSSAILAGSLDYEKTLQTIADLAVPKLADWCTVDLREDGDAEPRRVAMAHSRSEMLTFAAEYRAKYPIDWNGLSGAAKVLRTGASELFATVSDEVIEQLVQNPEQRAVIRSLNIHSAMIVPLMVHGNTIGVISFISAESGRSYDQSDLKTAEELGCRAGLAIENARLYRQAQQAVSTRDEFLSIASHELKTPLTSLRLQAQGARRILSKIGVEGLKGEKIQKIVESFDRQTDRLAHLIEDMLDISRINTGQLYIEREEIELTACIREVIDRLSEQLKKAGCELLTRMDGQILGSFDRERIEQAIMNLLSNAMKYGRGKPIEISVRADDQGCHIRVRDQGIGISPEDQARIFERFERAISPSEVSGLGLGLYIVRKIAELHGGEVRVSSTLGAGAEFTLSLPLRPSPYPLEYNTLH